MAFNINDIKSQLTFGGARPTLFQIQITNPVNGIADLKTPFMAKAGQIPQSTLASVEVGYFGRKVKLAGDRTFDDWSVTVFNDEDFLIRNALEQWSASINSHVGNISQFESASPNQYKSQASITQFSKTGVPIRKYTFYGIFPLTVGPIATDWDNNNQVETFDVNFTYDWWEASGITGNATTNQ
jgi:hypothetical protein